MTSKMWDFSIGDYTTLVFRSEKVPSLLRVVDQLFYSTQSTKPLQGSCHKVEDGYGLRCFQGPKCLHLREANFL